MFKCVITGNLISGRSPARVVFEVRPVRYRTVLQLNDRTVKKTTGYEIVKEGLVDPLIVSTLPRLEELIEKAKSKTPVLRTEFLAKRPKRVWVKRSFKREEEYTYKLKIVKRV